MEIDDNKLLRGILLTLLDGKSRDEKSKILKEAEFKRHEITKLVGESGSAARVRKHREKKKNGK